MFSRYRIAVLHPVSDMRGRYRQDWSGSWSPMTIGLSGSWSHPRLQSPWLYPGHALTDGCMAKKIRIIVLNLGRGHQRRGNQLVPVLSLFSYPVARVVFLFSFLAIRWVYLIGCLQAYSWSKSVKTCFVPIIASMFVPRCGTVGLCYSQFNDYHCPDTRRLIILDDPVV